MTTRYIPIPLDLSIIKVSSRSDRRNNRCPFNNSRAEKGCELLSCADCVFCRTFDTCGTTMDTFPHINSKDRDIKFYHQGEGWERRPEVVKENGRKLWDILTKGDL